MLTKKKSIGFLSIFDRCSIDVGSMLDRCSIGVCWIIVGGRSRKEEVVGCRGTSVVRMLRMTLTIVLGDHCADTTTNMSTKAEAEGTTPTIPGGEAMAAGGTGAITMVML